MIYIIAIASLILIGTWIFMKSAPFGAKPSGERQARIERAPQWNGKNLENQELTPALSPGYSYWKLIKMQFNETSPRKRPSVPIPNQKTDLKALNPEENVLIWMGHSSYFMQIDGVKILIDPVFSGSASPLPYSITAFEGTDIYQAEDFPTLDFILISHDHYDHLDYKTMKDFQAKTKKVIVGLGIGAHLERWGYTQDQIQESNWWETFTSENKLVQIQTAPARHFSGRGFARNNTLWQSYVVQSKNLKVYLGGDSGYGKHFKQIQERFGDMDLVMLDNGQYNEGWRAIHMHPEEVIQASKDLGAKTLFPVHNSKFGLALHAWDEPLIRTTTLAQESQQAYITPLLGSKVDLDALDATPSNWWVELEE